MPLESTSTPTLKLESYKSWRSWASSVLEFTLETEAEFVTANWKNSDVAPDFSESPHSSSHSRSILRSTLNQHCCCCQKGWGNFKGIIDTAKIQLVEFDVTFSKSTSHHHHNNITCYYVSEGYIIGFVTGALLKAKLMTMSLLMHHCFN